MKPKSVKAAVKRIHERAVNFLSRVLADTELGLADARRVVVYYQRDNGEWSCVYLRMHELHFAWASVALSREAFRGVEHIDEGEV